jgi:HEAT repeats
MLAEREDFVAQLSRFPARQVINALFLSLCSLDETVKWRAVTAFGVMVSAMTESDPEAARIVMRRFIWNLNDESGGIGWGAPEAMAEIMSLNPKLAQEYACVLVSYIRPDCNLLEHEILQRGVIWAVGRLAHTRADLVADAAPFLIPFMQSRDPIHRGLAAWAAGALCDLAARPLLVQLRQDPAELPIYLDGRLVRKTVGELACEALAGYQADKP